MGYALLETDDLRQNQGYYILFPLIQGRRSLMVASTGAL
jgi:hypothetical protein